MPKIPKVVVLDIETNGINGFKADLAYILCVGYSIYNEESIYCKGLDDFKTFTQRPYDDKELCIWLHNYLKDADVIAGHYLSRFDWPFIQSRFKKHGLSRLKHIKTLDSWLLAKNNLKFSSNRLANLANTLGLVDKKMDKGSDWSLWWKKAAAGELSAIRFIKKYCKQDIKTTKTLLKDLRSYWPQYLMGSILYKQTRDFPTYLKRKQRFEIKENTKKLLTSKILFGTRVDCWEWQGSHGSHGYSDIRFEGKTTLIHRLMYKLFINEIPKGLCLDHLCLNPGCVNPFHLDPCTRSENIKRALKAGLYKKAHESFKGKRRSPKTEFKKGHRLYSGETHPVAKFTDAQMKDIQNMRKEGKTYKEIKDKYNISNNQIYRFSKGVRK